MHSRSTICKSPAPLNRRKSPLIANGGDIIHKMNNLTKKRETIKGYLEMDRKKLISVLSNSRISISSNSEYGSGPKSKLRRTQTLKSDYNDINSSHRNILQIKYPDMPNGPNNMNGMLKVPSIDPNRRRTVNPAKQASKGLGKVEKSIPDAFQESELLSIQESSNESIEHNLSVDNEAKCI